MSMERRQQYYSTSEKNGIRGSNFYREWYEIVTI